MLPRGGGRCAPGVHFFSESLIFSPTALFLQDFPFELHFNSFTLIQMHRRPMLTLLKNRSRSSPGHDLYQHCCTEVIDASCHVSFWRRFLKGFNTYGHGSHLCHVTWIIYIYICSPFPQMIPIKFGFDWPSGFREDL